MPSYLSTIFVRLGRVFESRDARKARERQERGYDGGVQTVFPKIETSRTTQNTPGSSIDWSLIYFAGAGITGVVTFVGSWIYCIATYGYLFGVGLGWLPSLIVGTLAGYLWPIIVILALVVGAAVFRSN